MAMYKDTALPGGGADSGFGAGPPLALYDFIGQKAQQTSHAYNCNMPILGEEEEEEEKREDGSAAWCHNAAAMPPRASSSQEEENATAYTEIQAEIPRRRSYDSQGNSQPQLSRTETRPHIAQRETFPRSAAKRPNWLTIRYPTVPSRSNQAQLDAWVSGWSAAVGALGDETYCACAESTAANLARRSSSSSLNSQAGKNQTPLAGTDRPGRHRHRRRHQDVTAAVAAEGPWGVSFVCPHCSREPEPTVIPEQDFVFPPASGPGRMVLKCKLVWKRIVGRTVRRQSPDKLRCGAGLPGDASFLPGGALYDAEDGDDENEGEVDLDRLSASSRRGRAGVDIAERQARLRRAQRLLRKGAAAPMEPG